MKTALVLGAGGFIGGHLVERLKSDGYYVIGADLKYHEHRATLADEFVIADLRDRVQVDKIVNSKVDEIYQLAADMGGAGYIFTGEHDAQVMHNSATINLNVVDQANKCGVKKIFYSSSACMYPEYNQMDPDNPNCSEDSAYPANPDSEYGWEKLFSERLYLAYNRNFGMNCKIARFHNIFGPFGTWDGGREKAPAAMCRKVCQVEDGGFIEVWGDGTQTRSFLYVDECVDGILRLMHSNSFSGPVNIGSDEMVSINDFAKMVIDISKKKIQIKNIDGPRGVMGRNSDNTLIAQELGWKPSASLREGMIKTYAWISGEIESQLLVE